MTTGASFLAKRTLLLASLSAMSILGAAQIPVTTYHYDNARTGQNTAETVLAPSNVNSAQFGKLFTATLDGYVYAQPLYLPGVQNIAGSTHNVVYAATEHDSLYAIDADNGVILWQKIFLSNGVTSVSTNDVSCSDLIPEIGITGTPVIDSSTGTIYVVVKTKENGSFVQRLHALDVATKAEKFGGPVVISGTYKGVGFDPLKQGNRPGLLLENGHVIIAWASHCDNGPYQGWVMSYTSGASTGSLTQEAVFNTEPDTSRGYFGGIWMSGDGVASDGTGNLYFATGNGDFNASTGDYGDSIVKLSGPSGGSFTVADYYTPLNQSSLDGGDTDLGSGGVLLLPDLPSGTQLLVQMGKEGKMSLVNRNSMGKFCSSCSSQDTNIVQEIPGASNGVWGPPTFWNNNIYFGGGSEGSGTDHIKAWSFNANNSGKVSTSPTSQTSKVFSFASASPVVSSNGSFERNLWLLDNGSSSTQALYAYDATNLATMLYNSTQAANKRDTLGGSVKFSSPVVANGKVYVGSQSQLSAFAPISTIPTAASPTFNPTPGTYSSSQSVALSDTTPGNNIFYTTDGNPPTTSSTQYNSGSPIAVTANTTIKALATAIGYNNSAVSTGVYTITLPATATPTFSPVPATYTTAQSVSILDTTPNATIHYTTDGVTNPTTSSPVFNPAAPIAVNSNTTIKAMAVASGFNPSAVATGAYTIVFPPRLLPPLARFRRITQCAVSESLRHDSERNHPLHHRRRHQSDHLFPGVRSPQSDSGHWQCDHQGHGDRQRIQPQRGSHRRLYHRKSERELLRRIRHHRIGVQWSCQTEWNQVAHHGRRHQRSQQRLLHDAVKRRILHHRLQHPAHQSERRMEWLSCCRIPVSPHSAGSAGDWVTAPTRPAERLASHTASRSSSISIATPGEGANSTGLYTNGASPTTPAVALGGGVNLKSGDVFNVHLAYDGATLAMTITDAGIPADTFTTSWPINIPNVIGSSMAYAGFTGGTGGATATQEVIAWTYSSAPVTSAPTFSPVPNTYTSLQSVTLLDATPGATIYYTTDGTTTPTTSSPVFDPAAPIAVAINTTIKAMATSSGADNSAVATGTYTITLPNAATPTFNPVPATYGSAQSVSILDSTSGATIYYTTDGVTTPTTSSPVFDPASPIQVTKNTTIKAMAAASGFNNSAAATGAYTITLPNAATPTFTPVPATYSSAQSVTISDTTAGATLYYTTDGVTAPTTSSPVFDPASPIQVTKNTTIKAMAAASGFNNSAVASGAYTISLPAAATPTFNPIPATYTSVQSVSILDSTPGSTIYYTTDGVTTPTTSSPVFNASTPIAVATSTTIKAMAAASGFNNSAGATGAYVISSTGSPGAKLVQHAGIDCGTAATCNLKFASNTTAGNMIMLALRVGHALGTVTVTDTNKNTYIQAITKSNPNDIHQLYLFYAQSTASAADTVTVKISTSNPLVRMAILEYSGVLATGALDQVSSAVGSGTAVSSGSVITTAANELLIGVAANANGAAWTAGAGWVVHDTPANKIADEDQIVTAPTTAAATFNLSKSDIWTAIIATFKTQ